MSMAQRHRLLQTGWPDVVTASSRLHSSRTTKVMNKSIFRYIGGNVRWVGYGDVGNSVTWIRCSVITSLAFGLVKAKGSDLSILKWVYLRVTRMFDQT